MTSQILTKKKKGRTFFAGARLLGVVVFFAGAALALALPARTFLGTGFLAEVALGLVEPTAFFAVVVELTAFFTVVVLAAPLEAGAALVVFALVAAALGLEAGLETGLLEAGLF